MRKAISVVVLAAVALAFSIAAAFAAAPVPVQWVDAFSQALRTVSTGTNGLPVNIQDKDRDYPGGPVNLFTAIVLNGGATYQTPFAVDVSKFSRTVLNLSWTAAAGDSDSTAIGVRIYGKITPSSGNYQFWSPMVGVQPGDTCQMTGTVAADTGMAGVGRCLQPMSFVVSRKQLGLTNCQVPTTGTTIVLPANGASNLYQGAAVTGTGRVRIRKTPQYAYRFPASGGTNGIALVLADNAGNPCPFLYIVVEISNLTVANNLTNMQGDIVGRTW